MGCHADSRSVTFGHVRCANMRLIVRICISQRIVMESRSDWCVTDQRKERSVTYMSKDERKEMIENIAERFTQMDDVDKSYIAGYMAGKQEERQKWEQQGKTAVATA